MDLASLDPRPVQQRAVRVIDPMANRFTLAVDNKGMQVRDELRRPEGQVS
jgi:hypothetical protein